jgi:hypothetical protein
MGTMDDDILSNLTAVQRRKIEIEEEMSLLCETEEGISRRFRINCMGCYALSSLEDVNEAYWMEEYVEPHGCTGGDYFVQCNEVVVICPECSHEERYYGNKHLGDFDLLKQANIKYSVFKKLFGDKGKCGYREAPNYEIKTK